MTPKCPNCADAGWVCENHPDKPWTKEGCECGAGMPCPACNQSGSRDDPRACRRLHKDLRQRRLGRDSSVQATAFLLCLVMAILRLERYPPLTVFPHVEGDGPKQWKKTYVLKQLFTEAERRARPALENGKYSWQSRPIPLGLRPISRSPFVVKTKLATRSAHTI